MTPVPLAPPADPEADAIVDAAGEPPAALRAQMRADLDRIAASQTRTLAALLELLSLPPMGVLVLADVPTDPDQEDQT